MDGVRRDCRTGTHNNNSPLWIVAAKANKDGFSNQRLWFLMQSMFRLLAVTVLLTSLVASAQDRVQQVIAAAKGSPKLETNLRVLTDEIGGRVPGTPAMDKAIAWAVANFKDAG